MPSPGRLRSELADLFRVLRTISPGRTAAQTAAVLLLGITEGVGLVMLVPVVSALGPSGSVQADELPLLGSLGIESVSLETALAVLVLIVILRSLIARWSDLNGTALRLVTVDRLREDCLDAVLRARWEWVLTRRRSDVVETVTVTANRIGVAVDQSISLVAGVVITVVTAIVAVLISPLIASVAIVVSVAVAAVMLPVMRSARLLGREYGHRSRQVLATATDAMDALRLVRAHDAVLPWEEALDASFRDLRAAQVRHARAAATANLITSVLLIVGTAIFVLMGSRSDIAAATLVVLIVVLSRMARRFLGVAQQLPTLGISLAALGDLERVRRDAHAEAEAPHAPTDAVVPAPPPGMPLVALRAVSYRYPDGTSAVRHLDLDVPVGAVTVLVGPSGAGKSTIVDLVLGLLVPSEGTVLVAGEELTSHLLPHWRAGLGYVPQDTGLLPGTLRDNLVWSSLGHTAPDDECWGALDAAAATFARRLPAGLDTVLGDRGVRLSGGERQRVALARALIRRPRLLILDEATSALDYETEAGVLSTVRGLCPETTVLLVTHRISAIAPTDNVVRVDPPG